MESLTDLSDFYKWAETNDANPINKRQIQLSLGKSWEIQGKPMDE